MNDCSDNILSSPEVTENGYLSYPYPYYPSYYPYHYPYHYPYYPYYSYQRRRRLI